jgi:hypothetical protein
MNLLLFHYVLSACRMEGRVEVPFFRLPASLPLLNAKIKSETIKVNELTDAKKHM